MISLAAGPHPRRELTLMLALGFPWPRARMAAGAFSPEVDSPRREAHEGGFVFFVLRD
jgi:hypothetical protein